MFQHAFIQELGGKRLSHESKLVIQELKRLQIPYTPYTVKKIFRRQLPLHEKTLLVGDMDCTYGALKQLERPIPENNDYPKALESFLHRKVWRSTLHVAISSFVNDQQKPIFIKPAGRRKCFTGFVLEDQKGLYATHSISKNEPIFCSELVHWLSEYRVYVVDGNIQEIDHYAGNPDITLDVDCVQEAIQTLENSGESFAGYAIDFGVLATGETALVEMNDGFSIGAYDICAQKYTKMLMHRWRELMGW